MVVKKIMDYLKITPNNVNPIVLETVLNKGVEEAVSVANEYTDSQRLAYTEAKTLTWDGDDEGRANIPYSEDSLQITCLVHISNKYISGEALNAIHFDNDLTDGDDLIEKITKDNLNIESGFGITLVSRKNGSGPILMSMATTRNGMQAGTYVYMQEIILPQSYNYGKKIYISCIEYEEAIPIDQKFIPALPNFYLNGRDGNKYLIGISENGELESIKV